MTAVSSLNPTPNIDTHFIPTVAPHVLAMKCEIKPITGHQMNWWTIAVARHAYPCVSPIAEASWVQAPPTCWTLFFIYNLSSSPCNHSISSKADGGRQKEKLKIWAIYKPEIQWGLPSSHIPPLYSILSVVNLLHLFPSPLPGYFQLNYKSHDSSFWIRSVCEPSCFVTSGSILGGYHCITVISHTITS